jgi:multiple sugar transport system permease protein
MHAVHRRYAELGHRVMRLATSAALLTFALVPIAWLVLTSFKTRLQIFSSPPLLFFTPSFDSWTRLLQNGPMRGALVNSVVVAVASTIVTLGIAGLAAYAFSRFRFRGAAALLFAVLAVRLLPPINSVVVLYLLFNKLHLVDTILGLVILYSALLVPIAIWLLRNAFDAVPQELEEAAMIDGCSRLGALWRITIPLAAPGIAVTGLLMFILAWNEFLFAYIFTSTRATTVPVILAKAVGEYGVDWADLTAQATVLLLPVLAITLVAQRHLLSGLSGGAIK